MQGLIEKFLNRTISATERKRLKKWVLSSKENLNVLKKEIKNRSESNLHHHFDEKEAFKELKAFKRRKLHFVRYAALFIGVLTTGALLYFGQDKSQSRPESTIANSSQDQITITLADGSKQVIANNKELLTDKQGNVIALKEAEGLDFSHNNDVSNENLVFNEVYIPFGQKFRIILSDGTKVWLNSGSRLRFPKSLNTATSKNRVVYLEGEAYFDVTKDEHRPFIVNAENLDIKVLGTEFNVSAYKSDGEIATTLVEGSVNVYDNSNPDERIVLKPSFQASFVKANGQLTKQKVDARIYTGWMENRLIIDNLTFEHIIDKLERTHNVIIVNEVESLNKEVYKGEFENESIEAILNTIASSTPFTYKIENNVITISK